LLALFLDESGIFEKRNEPVQLNGGLLYRGNELNNALIELQTFLEGICRDNSLVYPRGLHGSEIRDRRLRRKVQDELLSFLGQGDEWSIVGLIAGKYERDQRSNLTDESTASNLYHSMLMRLLDNCLFYSGLCSGHDQADLFIASRTARISTNDHERQLQYLELGYDHFSPREGSLLYPLIDEPVIMAALNQLYEERESLPRLAFQLHVLSIYDSKHPGLMAADLVCNWLYGQVRVDLTDRGLTRIDGDLRDLGLESCFWLYDVIDDTWRELVDAARSSSLYHFYSSMYKHYRDHGGAARYYSRRWPVEPSVPDTLEMEEIKARVEWLESMRNLDCPRETFILESILDSGAGILSPLLLYAWHDLLLRLYNHQGNVSEALKHGEQALQIICSQPRTLDNYRDGLETMHRISVIETNRFNFRGAVRMLTQDLLPGISKSQIRIDDELGPLLDPVLGKCCSSLGQNLAFLGEYEKAMEAFNQALHHFAGDPLNEDITVAHILHLALARQDRDLFEQYAGRYFDDKAGPDETKLVQRWRSVLAGGNAFALFVFIKCINVFELWRGDSLLELIMTYNYPARFEFTDGHPWELIFRHLGEIAYEAGRMEEGHSFITKSLSVGQPEVSLTFRILHLGTRMVEAIYCLPEAELEKVIREVTASLQELSAAQDTCTLYQSDDRESWFYGFMTESGSGVKAMDTARRFIDRFTYAYR